LIKNFQIEKAKLKMKENQYIEGLQNSNTNR